MILDDIDHGTYAGAQQCKKRALGHPCEKCKKAAAEYQKMWRDKNPDAYARERARTSLLARAKTVLANRHRAELNDIIRRLEEQDKRKRT